MTMECSGCGQQLAEGAFCPFCAATASDPAQLKVQQAPAPSQGDQIVAIPERFVSGTLFANRYRVVHRLGTGGIGEVYRATDTRLEQTVALKFLYPTSLEDGRALERFRDEARLARRVAHGGVCRIFDFGTAEGLAYVAMEFIEGENLASVRKRMGRLSRERAREIALELCAGLGAIHEEGILHRDLKPANVMLDDQGRVRILDFGLAVRTEVLSGPEAASGTPAYRSPEQAAGLEATARSDLYSLGLILWELWTGEFLHPRDRREPTLLSSRVQGVDPALDRIVSRCLDFDPHRRPASAEAVAAALRETLTLQPGLAPRALLAADRTQLEIDPASLGELMESFGGQRAWDGQGSLWIFERAWDAVSFAVALRAQLETSHPLRLVLDVQEVELRLRQSAGTGMMAVVGDAAATARALLERAHPGQTLLTSPACRLARRGGRAVVGAEGLVWRSHGRYQLAGSDAPVEVFEVGQEDQAPLTAPKGAVASVQDQSGVLLLGWRPAPGVTVPHRPNFRIERRLGEGGFGEAWLVRHQKTGERRVFKFCFDGSRLRGLRREITLFRLLKEELGDRDDIARVLDWNLEEAPYFIESEYTSGGDLAEWAEEQGGIDRVPLEQRLELIAQVADALAAAHSVGVLHKDVKPGNILITPARDGGFKARLADFGVGLALDRDRLLAAGITVDGFTTGETGKSSDSASGTRLYMAPEVLEGRPPTLQADVYALGVVLYQVVVGQLGRAVAPGWREGIEDPLLVEDLAATLHGTPENRLANATELAARLRTLDERRAAVQEEARREKRRLRLEGLARRRRLYWMAAAAALMLLVAMGSLTGWALHEKRKEADARREAEAVTKFLTELFDIADPFSQRSIGTVVPELSVVQLLELGADRLDTAFLEEPHIRAQLLHKLAKIFMGLGQLQQAQELFESSLAIREEVYGKEHLKVAETLGELGFLLDEAGKLGASENNLRRALRIRQKHLPPDHLDIAESKQGLAAALWRAGFYEEAESLHRSALDTRRKVLGVDHYDIAESLNNLAVLLYDLGEFAESEQLLREGLSVARRVLGENHPDVATVIYNIANTLVSQGIYIEAERLYHKSIAMNQRLVGPSSYKVAIDRTSLAHLLVVCGRIQEAEETIQQAHQVLLNTLSRDHWRNSYAEAIRARILVAKGSFEEAEPVLQENFTRVADVRGPTSAETRHVLKYLVDLYEAWDKPEEAAKYRALWIEAGGRPEGTDRAHR
jgi:serine/threonine protein kinase